MSMLLNSRDLTGAMATSQQQQAITLLQEAVELTNGGRLPSGAANPLKPVHELTGEVLLGNRQPEEAARLFEEDAQPPLVATGGSTRLQASRRHI